MLSTKHSRSAKVPILITSFKFRVDGSTPLIAHVDGVAVFGVGAVTGGAVMVGLGPKTGAAAGIGTGPETGVELGPWGGLRA